MNFLIAVDTTDMSQCIIQRSLELIPKDSNVDLITIVEQPTSLVSDDLYIDQLIQKDYDNAEIFLQELVNSYSLKNAFSKLNVEVIKGNIIHVLQNIIDQNDLDYLIIGKSNKTKLLDKIFVGSTTNKILSEIKQNIIIIND